MSYKSIKKAGLSVELSLSLAFSVLVLFFAISLFSENFSSMSSASGINNMFSREGLTLQQAKASDRNSMELVQVTGSQGITIETIKNNAVTEITNLVQTYRDNGGLTNPQVANLASQLTGYTIASEDSSAYATIVRSTPGLSDVVRLYNISVYADNTTYNQNNARTTRVWGENVSACIDIDHCYNAGATTIVSLMNAFN